MAYYILVVFSSFLFALQFLLNQGLQKENGKGMKATFICSFYRSVLGIVIMLIISGFKTNFTPFSIIMGIVYSAASLSMTYFTLKAFSVANLSVYSVFSMLGGMLLPFLLGIGFYNEELTVFKALCCILIVIAVSLNSKSGQKNKKAYIYYMAVFILNGTAGVISKIHQSSKYPHSDSAGFMMISSIISLICFNCFSFV